jgi:hypothetical protein
MIRAPIAFAAAAVFIIAFAAWAIASDFSTLTFYIGDVQTRDSSSSNWTSAQLNQKLETGAELKTGAESRAELTLSNKSVIRIGENAHYKFEGITSKQGTSKTDGSLFRGRLWANVKKLTGKQDEFRTRTPTAVAAVRGTVFRMDVPGDSIAEIYVYEGAVEVGGPQWAPDYGKQKKWGAPKTMEGPKEVSMKEWTEIVHAQQKLTVGPKGVIEKKEFDPIEDMKDEWVKFNLVRDSILNNTDVKE